MTDTPGLRLRRLAFFGPEREPAELAFGPGLNVVYGASDTGKSFALEAIDYMLGGQTPLRDIPERLGYDQVLLGVETTAGECFTLVRGIGSRDFLAFEGMLTDPPPPGDVQGALVLAGQHDATRTNNLSMFLLGKIGLAGKRIRRNKRGDTNSLSFRTLAKLIFVEETKIQDRLSPLSTGNPTEDTALASTLKLLLTGVDDAASAALAPRKPSDEERSREAQLELLGQLIQGYRKRLRDLTADSSEIEEQLRRVDEALQQRAQILNAAEGEYRELIGRRRKLRERYEEGIDRHDEVGKLLERFTLLERHYASDAARLQALEEGGSLFAVLDKGPCSMCGALPEHHRKTPGCDGDVEGVVAAARAELAKLGALSRDLRETIESLRREEAVLVERLPRIEGQLAGIAARLEREVSPRLSSLRATYTELSDKRVVLGEARSLQWTLRDAEERHQALAASLETAPGGKTDASGTELPTASAVRFARHVEDLLRAWHFPEADRVYFDARTRDLVIGTKPRGSRGKGLRAVTHAAFTIGLLDYCRLHDLPHPGFVVLDSPLLAYRDPEGEEDDLRGTDLKDHFYGHLRSIPVDRQVLIFENVDPPESVRGPPRATFFSKNPQMGRYGFFPLRSATAA